MTGMETPCGTCNLNCMDCDYHRLKTKEAKYGWHDLRENPNDLPKEEMRIIFYTKEYADPNEERYWTGDYYNGNFLNDDYEGYFTISTYNPSDVIAWREFEPFEEDN